MSDPRSAFRNSPNTGSYERKIVVSRSDDTVLSALRSIGIMYGVGRQDQNGVRSDFKPLLFVGQPGQRSAVRPSQFLPSGRNWDRGAKPQNAIAEGRSRSFDCAM